MLSTTSRMTDHHRESESASTSTHTTTTTAPPRKSFDLNESTADTATTQGMISEDECSMSTVPSEYSSRGSSSRKRTVKVVKMDHDDDDVQLDDDVALEEKRDDNSKSTGSDDPNIDSSMAEVNVNDNSSSSEVKQPDMNDTHHTLDQAEDIDSCCALSDDSTQNHTNSNSMQDFSSPTRKPKRSTSAGSTAKFTANPKRAVSTSTFGGYSAHPGHATLMMMNGSASSFNNLKGMMNGSERSHHSSASERSSKTTSTANRPKVNCAPKRPTRFQAPRRAKSHSNLMGAVKKSSSGNLQAKGKPALVMSPKRSKKKSGVLGAMLDKNRKAPAGSLGAMLEKNRKAAAGRDLLNAVNLLDDDSNSNDDASVNSGASFHSKHSGFYPSDSITAEKVGQLSTLDLSSGDYGDRRRGDDDNNSNGPLSRSTHGGFSRPMGQRRKPRSMSFDNSYNKYAVKDRYDSLTVEVNWSTDTPWNTFAKNVNFLGTNMSIARFGKNFGVMADLMTGRREMMSTIDEDDSEELRQNEVHRQKQEEHHLATYLQNVSNQSRSLANKGKPMRNVSAESRKLALKGKAFGADNSSKSNNGGSERSARSWQEQWSARSGWF